MGKAATYLNWETTQSLVKVLMNDKKPFETSLLLIGPMVGLRWCDLRRLTWAKLMEWEFNIKELKTGNIRTIRIGPSAKEKVVELFEIAKTVKRHTMTSYIFSSRLKVPVSTTYANKVLNNVKNRFDIDHGISTHTLRKTFGRRVYDLDPCENTLMVLSEMFGHEHMSTTRRYLGLRKEEITKRYDDLF